MAENRSGIVWVLGAGFSRPLGAPLLKDLFSKTSLPLVRLTFPKESYPLLHTEVVTAAHWLYHCGASFPEKSLFTTDERRGGFRLWENAEEYLDYLDAAAERPSEPPAAYLRMWLDQQFPASARPDIADITAVRDAAKRLLAAECSAFLANAQTDTERWRPYRLWSRQIRANDTIITFNYDLVIEKIVEAETAAKNKVAFDIQMPGGESSDDLCPVLKLHGSVDWRRSKNGDKVEFEPTKDPTFALGAKSDEMALATPGPSKFKRAAELEKLWHAARRALHHATAIVFVGYRFPPTDSEARRRLLMDIRHNDRPYLSAHVVIGPETNASSLRLNHLLRFAVRGEKRRELRPGDYPDEDNKQFNVVNHPLFGEDFFTTYERSQVETPYRWQNF